MPEFIYTAVGADGTEIRGEATAPDQRALSANLSKKGLFLVYCREKGPAAPAADDQSTGKQSASPLHAGAILWSKAVQAYQDLAPRLVLLLTRMSKLACETISKAEALYGRSVDPSNTQTSPGWSLKKASPREALLVLVVAGGFLISLLYLVFFGGGIFPRSKGSVPAHARQSAISVKVVNGQERHTRAYPIQNARAADVKRALDMVMQGSSLSSQLDGNAIIATAADSDLQQIDVMIQEAEKRVHELTGDDAVAMMMNTMYAARYSWMNRGRPVKKPEANKPASPPGKTP